MERATARRLFRSRRGGSRCSIKAAADCYRRATSGRLQRWRGQPEENVCADPAQRDRMCGDDRCLRLLAETEQLHVERIFVRDQVRRVHSRSHGEPNFPDPSGSGALDFKLGHINPSLVPNKTAQAACQRVLPIGSSRGAQHPSKQAMGQAVKVSDCMRQHGVTGFPDPTTRMPRHPAAYSSIENNGGVVLAIPGTINTRSSAFKKATAACRLS